MLTHHIAVNAARVYLEVAADQVAESRGVERGAAADDALRVKAREIAGHLGHDIDRVGRNQEDAVKAGVRDRLHNRLKDGRVPREQIHAALARLLRDTRADGHDIRLLAVGVSAAPNLHMGTGEGKTVIQVHGLSLGFFLHIVNQDKLIAGLLIQHCIGIAHTDHAAANQYNSSLILSHDVHSFPLRFMRSPPLRRGYSTIRLYFITLSQNIVCLLSITT